MFTRSIIVRKSSSLFKTFEINIQVRNSSFVSSKTKHCYPRLFRDNSNSSSIFDSSSHNLHNSLVSQIHQTSFNRIEAPKQSTGEEPEKVVAKLSRKEKLQKAVKEYGSTIIVFHVSISLISLGTCYLLVSSGLDVAAVFKAVGLKDSDIANSVGTFAVAYALHKVFAPARIGITLTTVPFIVSYFRKIGYLKK